MIDSHSTRLNGLISPLRRWRGLDNVAKYASYTRISLQIIPVAVAIGSLRAAAERQVFGWHIALTSSYVVGILVFVILVYQYHPDLNTEVKRPVEPIFRVGLAVTMLGLVGSLILQNLAFSWIDQPSAITISLVSLFALSVGYIPWFSYRWIVSIVLTALVGFVAQLTTPQLYIWWLIPLFVTLTVSLSIWTVNIMKEVERSRELEASLRVTEERLRFSQELHDTLGQHLAAISLKSELALALARRGDKRIEGELRELQQLTRISMSQMREVVHGYRSINLATEIEGARSLLSDAHITVHTHGEISEVLGPQRALSAWLVREATTNVLRHSDATTVDLYLGAKEVRVTNNGVQSPIGTLSGLSALRQRAEAAGTSLLVEHEGDHFTVRIISERAISS
ncbi:sensor histidine kinase [Corynebacterium alimapuense]|uniref:Sensor histidine kinase n=1 Tax=Corynebacterium alimapuense TaxID=1576874 RepID=A0A3M8K5T8_9CORY|nr:histidine kinase [Corynebacterium alimapuense]RNE48593.1 sensor histidine kinase [Corynebacterium alimapuense]